ncbi:MAG: phytoene desaturase family protein [Thermogutta sp.]
MECRRVVIVGAGPGGLAAAMLLARAGMQVTVLERLPHVGGRNSQVALDGFRFDRGPTFLHYPCALREIFSAVGRSWEEDTPAVPLDPLYRLILGNRGTLDATPDVSRMEEQIRRISPADVGGFHGYLRANRVKLRAALPCLQRPFMRWQDFLDPQVLGVLPHLRPWASLNADLGRFFRDPLLRLAFTFQAKYLGMSPFRCPSLCSILSYLEYAYGIFHPIGGCNAVPRKMAAIAQELGADIRTAEEVQALRFQGRRVVAARTQEREYPCDALILNADFAAAVSRLVPNSLRRRWNDERLAKKRFSCSTFMLYLGIEGRLDSLAHHNIYVPNHYFDHLEDVEVRHVLSEEPAFYVQNACVSDASLAPPGMSTLYVLVPVSHQHPNIDWTRERDGYRRRVLEGIRRVFGIDLEPRIRVEQVWTPDDWEAMQIYKGATFNLAHSLDQMLIFRPHNRFEELEGVYLTGGGTHPGSGLPTIFESSRIAARLVLQDFGQDTGFLCPAPLSPSPYGL